MTTIASQIANRLLEIKAIKLQPNNPFTWASGWKSPIYCDNRITLSHPSLRSKITDYLVQVIKESFPETNCVAGVATAGIPQGALVADRLDLPFIYVRSKPKSHGMENLIEGKLIPGQKVIVIEDLISTGGSSLKAVEAIREAGGEVDGLLSTFNYGFEAARTNCLDCEVDVVYLSDYEAMLPGALEAGLVGEGDIDLLKRWREDPSNWP